MQPRILAFKTYGVQIPEQWMVYHRGSFRTRLSGRRRRAVIGLIDFILKHSVKTRMQEIRPGLTSTTHPPSQMVGGTAGK